MPETDPAATGPEPETSPAGTAGSQPEAEDVTRSFYYEPLPDQVIKKITGVSYEENENISLEDLRYMHILHYNFDAEVTEGELICNKAIADDLLEIFYELYLSEYKIEKVRLIDEYGGDDTASMEDNNTSCFNYRVVDGTTSLSKHAYGLAIDINPFYNPYVVFQPDGDTYISEAAAKIMLTARPNFLIKSTMKIYATSCLWNMALSGAEIGTPVKTTSIFKKH